MITDLQHRNTFLLAGAQALYQTAMIVMVTVGGLVGLALAPDPRLSTLPLAAVMLAGTISMVPAALMMQRYGRRAGFLFGCRLWSIGTVGGSLISCFLSFQNAQPK